jgi:hypothetical protein
VSRLIHDILREFYHEAAGRPLLTGMVIAHQTFGDMLRWNPHFHAIVLEGGFDDEGTFFFIPFSGLQSMVEVFRHRVIKLLVQRELLNEDLARNLKDGGKTCPGLRTERRTGGRLLTQRYRARTTPATNRFHKAKKRSTSMRASVPGSSDSRSDIANPKGPTACEGL